MSKKWTLTAQATNISGDDVSVQLTSDINEFARQGFWTDKMMTNGTTINNVSARGSKTVTGTGPGTFPLTVFLPENISDSERTVTLTVSVDGAPSRYAATQQITQLCPAWNGNFGWEQINDNQNGNYGFDYTARHVYVYNDGDSRSVADRIIALVNNLIDQYNARKYASVTRYLQIIKYRNYVDIDYRKLNNLGDEYKSVDNGLINTRNLFTLGGTALTYNFENALDKMIRPEGDKTSKAYVKRRDDDPRDVPQWIEGDTTLIKSGMLVGVLKKNKYYLNTTVLTSGGNELRTTTALIRESDIKWYIPAKNQFGGAPVWHDGVAMNPGEYWSSTAADGSTSYLGNGATERRRIFKSIRVMRTRE